MTLIKLTSLPTTERTRPLINEIKRIVFDANVFIMQGKKDYPYGERCYKRAVKLLEKIKADEL